MSTSDSTLCLSLPATLRCAGLTRNQSTLLIIPPIIEFVIVLSLVYFRWRRGQKHWFLVSESLAFFILAISDYATNTNESISRSMEMFMQMDRALGALSFIPILLYVIFLFAFAQASLLPPLPRRFHLVIKFTLLAFILPLVIFNETGALYGIIYTTLSPGPPPKLAVGFVNAKTKMIWMFLNSTTLALLIAYQFIVFLLVFFHIVRNCMERRRFSPRTSAPSLGDPPSTQGFGWIAAAIKLGAIETIIGFAGLGFEGAIARRMLRVVVRLILVVGLARCVSDEQGEGFWLFRSATSDSSSPSTTQMSGIRALISGPRSSTFAQLSPNASKFHNLPRARPGLSNLNPDRHVIAPFPEPDEAQRRAEQRVTIRYDNDNIPPALEVRFSALGFPLTSDAASSISSSSHSHGGPSLAARIAKVERESTVPRGVLRPEFSFPPRPSGTSPAQAQSDAARQVPAHYLRKSSASEYSNTSDALEVVREIANRFPGLPPRVAPRRDGAVNPFSTAIDEGFGGNNTFSHKHGANSLSSKRKPAPIPSPGLMASFPYPQNQLARRESLKAEPRADVPDDVSPFGDDREISPSTSQDTYQPPRIPFAHEYTGSGSTSYRDSAGGSSGMTRVGGIAPYHATFSPTKNEFQFVMTERPRIAPRAKLIEQAKLDRSQHDVDVPSWLPQDDLRNSMDDSRGLVRIKSTGHVNVARTTPSPSPGPWTRHSVVVEHQRLGSAFGSLGSPFGATHSIASGTTSDDSRSLAVNDRNYVRRSVLMRRAASRDSDIY